MVALGCSAFSLYRFYNSNLKDDMILVFQTRISKSHKSYPGIVWELLFPSFKFYVSTIVDKKDIIYVNKKLFHIIQKL